MNTKPRIAHISMTVVKCVVPTAPRLLQALVVTASCFLTAISAHADAIDQGIAQLQTAIIQDVQGYMGNYPAINNDPNPVRRRFLGVDPNDQNGSSFNYSADLLAQLNQALTLRQQPLTDAQLDPLSAVINLGLDTALQGFLISGNISLLESLRISYPSGGAQARPTNPTIPYGCVQAQFPFVVIEDASTAENHYAEGVRALANVFARHAGNTQGKVIVDVDTDPIPYPQSTPGWFDNTQFPQYTYYVSLVPGQSTNIAAIQTPASIMGQLLAKQAQASQTVGYRLWTAAYFNSATANSPSTRQQLLDAAVHELHAGANLQFLCSVALAANVGDQALSTPQSPFELTGLNNARANVTQAKATIDSIRNNEKPTLPVSEIMAGDSQVNNLIQTIKGNGAGSINKAQASYMAAENALFKVQNNALDAFNADQTRQTGFYNQLLNLTGIAVDPVAIQTPAGQGAYRQQVADAINALMSNPNAPGQVGAGTLITDIQQLNYLRQEVINKKQILDDYPAQIKIVEDTLGANISAIQASEGAITAAQLGIGIANSESVTISQSASVTVGLPSGLSFTTGISETSNPGAIQVASLQNDITRATDLQQIKFLQNDAAAQCQNLLLKENEALGDLKSQIILLNNAEANVKMIIGSVDQILAQLRSYDSREAQLFYNDPTFNQALTAEETQANVDLAAVTANLYQLGQLLSQRWLEPFENPVSVINQQPIALGDPSFDNFWSLESVFALGSVDIRDDISNPAPPYQQAQNFFSALRAWDTLLRSGIRSFDGDLAAVEISLRQDVFGYADVKTVNGEIVPLDLNPFTNPNYLADKAIHDRNVSRFHNLLLNHGLYFYNAQNLPSDKFRGFLLPFSLSYYDVGFTDGRLGLGNLFGQINAWNFRLTSFKIKVNPLSGKNVFTGQATTPIIFAQSGLTSDVDFFERNSGRVNTQRRAESVNLDNYVRYNLADLNLSTGSPYLLFSVAQQNSYPPDSSVPTAAAMQADFWSPFCSKWLLEFVPVNGFEIENIDDIVIQMGLKSGAPNAPNWGS